MYIDLLNNKFVSFKNKFFFSYQYTLKFAQRNNTTTHIRDLTATLEVITFSL